MPKKTLTMEMPTEKEHETLTKLLEQAITGNKTLGNTEYAETLSNWTLKYMTAYSRK